MGRNLSVEGRDRLLVLSHVTASIGHQVINSFSAIVSSAELIRIQLKAQSSETSAEVVEFLDSIVRNALNSSTVMREMIDFSHRSAEASEDTDGKVRDSIDLNALLDQVIEEEGSGTNGEVVWRVNLEPIPPVMGDVRQLRIAFHELFRNALEALPDGPGTVSVRTRLDKMGWIVIEISDSGVGMTQENMGHALEPFFTTKEGHLGVGLAIARGIWRRHQGALSIMGPSAQGTVIRLTIEPVRESIDSLLRPRVERHASSN